MECSEARRLGTEDGISSTPLDENTGPMQSDWIEILFMKTSAELEQQAALQVASLMAAAARTAPKTRGIDNMNLFEVEVKQALGVPLSVTGKSPFFDRKT